MSRALMLSYGAAGSSAWTPASLSGLVLWLDHDSSITETSGAVDQWNDRSGNGHHGTSTTTARPTLLSAALNGHSVLSFNGTSSRLSVQEAINSAGDGASGLWCFAVYKNLSSSAAIRTVFGFAGSGSNVKFTMQTSRTGATDKTTLGVRRLNADSFTSLSATTGLGTSWGLAMVRMDYANGDGYVDINGTLSDATNTSLTSNGTVEAATSTADAEIGRSPALSNYADMDLACLLYGTGNLSTSDVDKLFGYYAHEYALTANLPALHPYKSSPP